MKKANMLNFNLFNLEIKEIQESLLEGNYDKALYVSDRFLNELSDYEGVEEYIQQTNSLKEESLEKIYELIRNQTNIELPYYDETYNNTDNEVNDLIDTIDEIGADNLGLNDEHIDTLNKLKNMFK